MSPEKTYNDVLSRARKGVATLSGELDEKILAHYESLLDRIFELKSAGRLTETRADALALSIREIIRDYSSAYFRDVTGQVGRSATLAARGHSLAVSSAGKLVGMDISESFDNVPQFAVDWMIQRREFATKYGATSFSEFFKAVTTRNAQRFASSVDRYLAEGVALGLNSRDLTQNLAYTLAEAEGLQDIVSKLGARGGFKRNVPKAVRDQINTTLEGPLKDARSLIRDTRRIAVHELNSAFDETDKIASAVSPLVAALKWTRSGRHAHLPSTPDRCDLFADGDFFGLGAGVFPAESVPPLPHPFCLCYTVKLLRPVADWTKPKDAPPAPKELDPGRAEKIFGKRYTSFTGTRSENRLLRELEEAQRHVHRSHGLAVNPKGQIVRDVRRAAEPQFDTLPGGFKVEKADTSWKDLPLAEKRRYADRFVRPTLSDHQFTNLLFDSRTRQQFRGKSKEAVAASNRNFIGDVLPGHALDDLNRALAESAGRFHINFHAIHKKTRMRRALGTYSYSKGDHGPDGIRLLSIQQTNAKSARKKGFASHEWYQKNREKLIAKRQEDIDDPKRKAIRDRNIQELEKLKAATRWSVPDSMGPDNFYGVIHHEIGHAVMWQVEGMEELWHSLVSKIDRLQWFRVSEYAGSKATELWAETFAAVMTGQHNLVPEPILEAFVKVMKEYGHFLD